MKNSTVTKEEIKVDEEVKIGFKIVVFNDDHNPFGHVIAVFMAVLRYSAVRSEQLAWNIHNTGQAIVKEGELEELLPICTLLCDAGLDAQIT